MRMQKYQQHKKAIRLIDRCQRLTPLASKLQEASGEFQRDRIDLSLMICPAACVLPLQIGVYARSVQSLWNSPLASDSVSADLFDPHLLAAMGRSGGNLQVSASLVILSPAAELLTATGWSIYVCCFLFSIRATLWKGLISVLNYGRDRRCKYFCMSLEKTAGLNYELRLGGCNWLETEGLVSWWRWLHRLLCFAFFLSLDCFISTSKTNSRLAYFLHVEHMYV